MFSCHPVSSLTLHECLFPDDGGAAAGVVAKAQCLRNELCAQRDGAECGLARAYYDALSESVSHIKPSGGYARTPLVAKWCVGTDWIATMSGVRGELALALLASVYVCVATPTRSTPADFAHALDSLKLLHECLSGWANMPRKGPLFDFETAHLNALRVYCHAALNIAACGEIDSKNDDGTYNLDALTVKAQCARHAYELLAPSVSSAVPTHPRARAVRDLCVALHRDAVAQCFTAAATLHKERETYDTGLKILEKGLRLLGPDDAAQKRELDVLTRNISDLKSVFSRNAPPSMGQSNAFDWSMIPSVECILLACTCSVHTEAYGVRPVPPRPA